MKAIKIIVLIAVIAGAGFEIFQLYQQNLNLKNNLSKLNIQVESIAKENAKLQADLSYFSNVDNLEKELRSRLNFKSPGENLIIVIPPKSN